MVIKSLVNLNHWKIGLKTKWFSKDLNKCVLLVFAKKSFWDTLKVWNKNQSVENNEFNCQTIYFQALLGIQEFAWIKSITKWRNDDAIYMWGYKTCISYVILEISLSSSCHKTNLRTQKLVIPESRL